MRALELRLKTRSSDGLHSSKQLLLADLIDQLPVMQILFHLYLGLCL